MGLGGLRKTNGADAQEERDDLADINIIPLVDVMLVLLIIFMVTAPLSIGGIKIELPQSKATGMVVKENRIILSVTAEGEFYIEKMNIPGAVLQQKMKALYQYRQNKELFVRADRNVAYGRVVDAMGAAKLAGVDKIGMLTQFPIKAANKGKGPATVPR